MALPITVPLLPEETMLSFASRLAAANGVGRLSNLCAHLGLDLKALVRGDEGQIQRLAGYGGVDARELANRIFRPSGDGFVWFGSERLALSAIHRQRMRACPQCVARDRAEKLSGIPAVLGRGSCAPVLPPRLISGRSPVARSERFFGVMELA